MKSIVGRLLGFVAALGLVAVMSSPAFADRDDHPKKPSHSAPEIDPAGLAAVGALLVGGTLLLKSRRAKN
jgi:hypothetical protein